MVKFPIILFFLCIAALFYIFFGYPLLLFCMAKFKKPADKPSLPDPLPPVSIVIPAFNEENCIKSTIENILNVDYPKDKFELIIVSDASMDGTDKIVAAFQDKSVRLIRLNRRGGAGKAIDTGIRAARFEFVITSDGNSIMDKDMIKYLVGHFQDAKIGGVSGDKIIRRQDAQKGETGESVYWEYENTVKNYEYKTLGTALSSDNVNFALRKNIFTDDCPPIIGHDFWLSLYIANKGYKIAYEAKAKVYEEYEADFMNDFKRKIRVILGGLQAVFLFPRLLFSLKNFNTSFQLISHKIMRWLASIFLILFFISNLLLLNILFFQIILALQCFFYLMALIGVFLPAARKFEIIRIITYFVSMNIASLAAIYRYSIKGEKKQPLWDKIRG